MGTRRPRRVHPRGRHRHGGRLRGASSAQGEDAARAPDAAPRRRKPALATRSVRRESQEGRQGRQAVLDEGRGQASGARDRRARGAGGVARPARPRGNHGDAHASPRRHGVPDARVRPSDRLPLSARRRVPYRPRRAHPARRAEGAAGPARALLRLQVRLPRARMRSGRGGADHARASGHPRSGPRVRPGRSHPRDGQEHPRRRHRHDRRPGGGPRARPSPRTTSSSRRS